jgi:hypothetical protein
MIEPMGCPETSVRNYRSKMRNIPDERRSRLHRGRILKSHIKPDDVTGRTYLKHKGWRSKGLKTDIKTKGFKTMQA